MNLKIAVVAVLVCFIIASAVSLAIFGFKDLQLAGIATFIIMLLLLCVVVAIGKAGGVAVQG